VATSDQIEDSNETKDLDEIVSSAAFPYTITVLLRALTWVGEATDRQTFSVWTKFTVPTGGKDVLTRDEWH
jgi:hypothetical protein